MALGKSSILAALCATAAVTEASAQEVKSDSEILLDEIIVTATRRSESIFTVPISITALSGRDLEQTGAAAFADYAAQVPNLSFAYSGSGQHGSRSVALRGVVGSGTTGVYIDDTPVFASLDPRVVDLERIEILRGPQGTLYGARSMGGTIRLITRQPDVTNTEWAAHSVLSSVEEGGINSAFDAVVNVPIVPGRIGVRALMYRHENSGIYDRVPGVLPLLLTGDPTLQPSNYAPQHDVDSEHVTGGSLAARIELNDGRFIVTPRVQYQRVETGGMPFADVQEGNFTQLRLFDIDERGEDEWRHYSLTASYEMPRGRLVSATGYFDRQGVDHEDFSELAVLFFGIPATPALITRNFEQNRFVQEARYSSELGGPLEFTIGAFYADTNQMSEFPVTPILPYFTNVFSQNIDQKITETALFGEVTYSLSQSLSITGGLRWFDNKIEFVGSDAGLITANETYVGAQGESSVTPKISVNYDIGDSGMLYASAGQGLRLGGVNSFSQNLCAPDLASLPGAATYNSDSLWSYEAGYKTNVSGFRLSTAAYFIDWSDVQQVIALSSCGFAAVVNVGAAEIAGLELEVEGDIGDHLTYGFGLGYADTEITDNGGFAAIPIGSPLQQVPEWTANGSLVYKFELAGNSAYVRTDYNYVGESSSANNSSLASPRARAAYQMLDLRAGIQVGEVEISVFAKNALDEAANYSDIPPLAAEFPTRPRIVTNRPRTIGIEFRARQ
jgi:outer membrane receptor protein involved in Fe transport